MFRLLISVCAALLAQPAAAAPFLSDAFGLYDPANGGSSERARWAGYVTRIGENTADGWLIAAQPPESLLVFVGPKSLVAGKDHGHAVAISLDRAGNLAAAGSAVDFRIGDVAAAAATRSGIADHLFLPPPASGLFHAGATAGNRQSARAEFRVVADLASVRPNIPWGSAGPVAAEIFHRIATGPLIDRFGNTIEDGVAVNLRFEQPDGQVTLATGVSLDGRAAAQFLTRDIAGTGTLSALLGRQASPGRALAVAAPQQTAPLAATAAALPQIGATRIRLGPFLTSAGYLLNDGAPVSLSASSALGDRAEAAGWLRDGYYSATLPIGAEGFPLTVTVTSPLGPAEVVISRTGGTEPMIAEVTE